MTSRREVRPVVFLLAWVIFLCASDVTAEVESKRFPIKPWLEPSKGTYLKSVEEHLTPGKVSKHGLELIKETAPESIDSIESMTNDELVKYFVVIYDDYQTFLLNLKLMSEMYPVQRLPIDLPPGVADKWKMEVFWPDYRVEDLPLFEAWPRIVALLNTSLQELSGRTQTNSVAGSYESHMEGNCPFEVGPVSLQQRDSYIEVTRGSELLFSGAIGDKKVALVAVEQRYVLLTFHENKPPVIDVPDKPPRLFEGRLEKGMLRLADSGPLRCVVILHPERRK